MADILIVEDELSINELIRRNLGLAGHRCTQAFDGEEAIELLGEKTFDLVILDIMLPGADGYEVFDQTHGIPVIFLTAKSELYYQAFSDAGAGGKGGGCAPADKKGENLF